MAGIRRVNPDLNFIREVRKAGGDSVKKCFQCATCSVVCNLSPDDKPFPRKEMILTQWGQIDRLVGDPDVWLCYQCNDCSTHCPRGADPGDVLAAIRAYVYRSFAFPAFMGRALANPRMFPILILIPILILLACIHFSAPRANSGNFMFLQSDAIDFDLFLPHSTVDALFVGGNILIFVCAAFGFLRFWKRLRADGIPIEATFRRALLSTVIEIVKHSRFMECDTNKQRGTAHIFIFFGFIGAMITTGLVFIFIFIPHYLNLLGLNQFHSLFELPLNLPHPVKLLGAASGLLLVLGGAIMIFRRWGEKDEVGASGYVDQLFLYVIFFTGLTGMGAWLIRAAGSSIPAYVCYFLHIVCVYFLLWYMPYSKFAHMIYRALALIHAQMIGRQTRT
jgi:quinone-modifying oxidoreductase subunit QmoC